MEILKEKSIYARMFQKHGTAEEWNNSDFIPEKGEIIIYDPDSNCDTGRLKVGDGKTYASQLDFLWGIEGRQGETGVGILATVLNEDYTLTIYYTNNTSYTTPSIRGL
jgi:hypothetical protein